MAWIKTTMDEFNRKLWSLPADQQYLVNGWSPGYVSARLGVTRSAVHGAIRRDKMNAYRILGDDGKLAAIIIPEASVREYENSETRRKHTPLEFRETA